MRPLCWVVQTAHREFWEIKCEDFIMMCTNMYDGVVTGVSLFCDVTSLFTQIIKISLKKKNTSILFFKYFIYIKNDVITSHFLFRTKNRKPMLTVKIKASAGWQDVTSSDHLRYRPLSLSLSLSRSLSLARSLSLSRRGPPRSRSRCRSRSRRLLTTACVRRRKSSTRMS